MKNKPVDDSLVSWRWAIACTLAIFAALGLCSLIPIGVEVVQAAVGSIMTGEYQITFGGASSGTGAKYTLAYEADSTSLNIGDGTNAEFTFTDNGTTGTFNVPGGQITTATVSALTVNTDNLNASTLSSLTFNSDSITASSADIENLAANTSSALTFSAGEITVTGGSGLPASGSGIYMGFLAGAGAIAASSTFPIVTLQTLGIYNNVDFGVASTWGNLKFGDYISANTSASIADSTYTTVVNFARSATAITAGTFSGLTSSSNIAFNNGYLTSTSATGYIFDATYNTTLNFARNATAITAGTFTGLTSSAGVTAAGNVAANGGYLTSTSSTCYVFAAAQRVDIGAASSTCYLGHQVYVNKNEVHSASGPLYLYPLTGIVYTVGNNVISGNYTTTTVGEFTNGDTTPDVSAYNIWRCYGTAATITALDNVTYPMEITILGSYLNEQQTVTITLEDPGDTFTVTYGGQTTAALAYDVSAVNLQAALEGLSSVGAGNIAVSGTPADVYTLIFQGALAEADKAEVTCAGTGCTATPATTVVGGTDNTGVISDGAGMFLEGNWTTNGNAQLRLIYDARAGRTGLAGWREISRKAT